MKKKIGSFLQGFRSKKAKLVRYVSIVQASEFFDESWYLNKYEDVRISGIDAATHYVKYGWKEGRNPGPDFDTNVYLSNHKEIQGIDVCPLVHYIENSGERETESSYVTRLDSSFRKNQDSLQRKRSAIIERSAYFDSGWYSKHYSVSDNPIAHYQDNVYRCNPSLLFDSVAYLEAYQDVKKANINPLLHYEVYGKHEGRYPFPVSTEESSLRLREQLKNGKINDLKVLYISTTQRVERPILDASTRYRCYHPAEELQDAGALVHVISTAKLLKMPVPYDYDIYVFHRPSSGGLEKVIKSLKEQNKILVAEYDDLIFGGEEEALNSSIFKNKVKPKLQCIEIFKSNAKALSLFDYVSVSTENLKSCVLRFHPVAKVHVIHNFIPRSILTLARELYKEKKDPNQVIYCCGTLSHNADFKKVSQELLECLKADKSLRLILMGPLTVDGELLTLPNVFFHPHVGYWDLFRLMANSALSIAPLEMSLFNDCKSNVKFLESCVAGTHLLATPIPDMVRVGDANIDLCSSPSDFRKIIQNRHELSLDKMAEQNYAYLVNNCSSSTFLSEFLQLIKDIDL